MNDIRQGILATANALGIRPLDLATAISYETAGTFSPTISGPTTKWGTHRGLIQFGEPQARQYGVDWSNPVGSQLGPDGAVAKYLRGAGVQPGMGLLDIYSAINAGGVGRYGASDAAAGGAPGTVADKVREQMSGHRQKAAALLGEDVAAGTMAALGYGQQTTTSTQGEPARKPSIWDKIGGPLADPDKRARLAMALEGLTLNPNQGVIEGAKQGIQQRADAKRINQTAAWLRSQGRDDLAQAVEGGMIGGGDAFAAMQAQAQANQPQNVQYGLSPQPFVRKDGSIGIGVLGDDGSFKEVQLPDGAEIAKGIDKIDAGDRWIFQDKFGNKVGEQMKNLEAAAEATARGAETGKIEGAAKAGAPGEVTAADEAIGFISELRRHPALDVGTGGSSVFNKVPGTPGYDFQNRVNQVKSGAFLSAIDQMRGLGALSNAEGQTATAAIARLDSATSKEEFLEALADYERIVEIGRKRSAARIGGAVEEPGAKRRRYNPATGAIE